MRPEKLTALREELEERRETLLSEQNAKIMEVRRSADHVTSDTVDLASEAMEFDVTVHSAFRGGEELESVLNTLQKLEAGTYGCCEDCRGEIAEKRLEALPLAALCIDCQREFEKHGGYARTAFDDASYDFDDEDGAR